MSKKITIVAIFILSIPLFSAFKNKAYRCYKPVKIAGNKKLKQLYLDKEVYKYANYDLSDLRLVDNNKKLIPYYLEHGSKQYTIKRERYRTKLIYTGKTNNSTIFEFQVFLPEYIILPIDSLLFQTSSKNFSRQIEVYGRSETGNWQFIKRDSIYDLGKTKKLTSKLNSTDFYKFFRIIIRNNNRQLRLTGLYLQRGKPTSTFSLFTRKTPLQFTQQDKGRWTVLSIQNPDRLKIQSFTLKIAAGNFQRKTIFSAKNPPTEDHQGAIYNFISDKITVSDTTITFAGTTLQSTQLILKIYNGDDSPLQIKQVTAKYTVDRIVFKHTNTKKLRLYFGNSKAAAPEFDLVNLKQYIANKKKDECSLGKIHVTKLIKPKQKNKTGRTLFNIITIIVSATLIAFLLGKIAKRE